MEGTEDLEMQVPRNSPAYGAWNVSIVAAGTGEALSGPVICEVFMVATSWAWWPEVVTPYNQ